MGCTIDGLECETVTDLAYYMCSTMCPYLKCGIKLVRWLTQWNVQNLHATLPACSEKLAFIMRQP